MKLTEIHVGWEETCSLPQYSNIRPSVHFHAVLEEGDDLDQVQADLLAKAQKIVRDQCDEALELVGENPKYYQGQLAQVIKCPGLRTVVVLDNEKYPAEIFHRTNIQIEWAHVFNIGRGKRPETALAKAEEYANEHGYAFLNCLSGDLSPLQKLIEEAVEDTKAEASVDEESFLKD